MADGGFGGGAPDGGTGAADGDPAAGAVDRAAMARAVAVAALALAAAVTINAGTKLWWADVRSLEDLDVYRRAGQAVLDGTPLYEAPGDRLVFTYPPAAALVSVPLAPLPQRVANLTWTLVQVLVLCGLVSIAFRALLARLRPDRRVLTLGLVAAALALTQPFVENLTLGQVNVVLAGLVVADLLARRRWWPQGALIGLATALKLTPGIFALYLAVTRRWRAALVAASSFLAVTVVTGLVLPEASSRYWTEELRATERIGGLAYTSNQSLRGVVERLVPGEARAAVWLLAAGAMAVVGLRRAAAAHRRGDEVSAVAIVGLVGVLVSPIAWIHHLVWMVFALGALVGDGRDRRRVALAAAVVAFMIPRLPWLADWLLLETAAGASLVVKLVMVPLQNSFAVLAVACVLAGPVPRRWRPPVEPATPVTTPA
jgi:alpha-1,2-mannosyltransferase